MAVSKDLQPREVKNPGREGGPLGFFFGANGMIAIGDDGFPMDDEELLDRDVPRQFEIEQYAVIDIEPTQVDDRPQ